MTLTPVDNSVCRIKEPETKQAPDTSEEIAMPRLPSSSCTNFAGGVIGAGALDSLPHNGAVVTLLAVWGSGHGKDQLACTVA